MYSAANKYKLASYFHAMSYNRASFNVTLLIRRTENAVFWSSYKIAEASERKSGNVRAYPGLCWPILLLIEGGEGCSFLLVRYDEFP